MFKKQTRGEALPTFLGRVAKTLELPMEVAEGMPQIELLGNQEATVEHCQRVLEYNDKVVRLHTGRMVLRISGRGLRMSYLAGDLVRVEGWFSTFEFQQP